MERNKDFRRATVSGISDLPRRRQRITTFRDSTDEDRQMELKETVRSRDRERLQKKKRDRDFPKRRRVDRSAMEHRSGAGGDSYRENESSDSSDEEYCEEEEELKNYHHKGATNQLSPSSSSLSNNRRGIRTLRSSPVFRFPSDEIFGVPVPRRARSVSAKRLQKCWISGSVGFGEDLSHPRFSRTTVSPISFGGSSPASSSDSMKKMKSAEPRSRVLRCASNSKPSAIQDDIEIEVAEALFDLMQQLRSQPQSSKFQEKVDRESTSAAECELQRLKPEGGGDENNSFSVQKEQSKEEANAETTVVGTMKDLKKERRGEKDKISDDPGDGLVGGNGFMNKGTLGSQKENTSASCVKVNACDIKDPTVTKAEHAATAVEAKEAARLDIDLMASPPRPSLPERDALVETEICPKVMTRVVQKGSEIISLDGLVAVAIQPQKEAIGALSANQLPDHDFEKRRHGVLNHSNEAMQIKQPHNQKELKSQPTPLFPFPIGMSSWSGVLPYQGCVPPLQTPFLIDGKARSTMIMQPPQFKLSLPPPKRCAAHQHIAHNIDHHQQLIKKSLSSRPTGPVTSYGTELLNPKTMLPTQILGGSGKDESPGAAAAFSAASNAKPALQHASNQAPAKNLLHCPGFMFPLGHHQASMMAPASSSGPPLSTSAASSASLTCNSAGKPSANLSFPAVSFNHPIYPSNGTAPYTTILQNNGGPIPISSNIPFPSFKGGSPSMPVNSSLYSSSVFNISNQHQFSPHHAPVQSSSQNTAPFNGSSSRKQPERQKLTSTISENKISTSAAGHSTIQPNWPSFSSTESESEIGGKTSPLVADGRACQSVKSSHHTGSSVPVQPMSFAAIHPLSMGGGGFDIKNGDHSQQGSKGRVELMPPTFALSFDTNPSTDPAVNFSSILQSPTYFQVLSGTQMAQQKNFQSSEGKFPSNGDHSLQFSRSEGTDMTSISDGLTRTVYYCPSSLSGNQPFQASSAALTSGVPPTMPNFQQQHHQLQLTQLQQHHVHQMQLTGASQVKVSAPNSIPGAYLGSSFPTNSPIYCQLSAQPDISSFPSKWMNSSQPATLAISNIPQLKSSQGQTHITFRNVYASAAASLQGQHVMIKGQQESSSMACSSLKALPSVSALPSPQETGTSPKCGPSQKSPPACRRNIPSILSTCPNQLPELKY